MAPIVGRRVNVVGWVQLGVAHRLPHRVGIGRSRLDEHGNPTEEQLRRRIHGNICRCTGYVNIVEAIKAVAG